MMFTDYYAEKSCTAGRRRSSPARHACAPACPRSAFPARTVGLQARDITIAEALKPLGYATGQFGKNHLGDRNEFLPTMHGFDEFFGNLYHLNAEEEPENRPIRRTRRSRPSSAARRAVQGATDRDDPRSIRASAASASRPSRTPAR